MRTCCHCHATSSPCWRRGPPEAPLLCNACGAHYLAKRSLAGYWPKGYKQRHDAGEADHCPRNAAACSAGDLNCPTEDSGASSFGRYQQQQQQLSTEDIQTDYSSKRPRLVCCRVYEIDVQNSSAFRLLKTFETADGVVLTVIRRPRKQLKPRACAVA